MKRTTKAALFPFVLAGFLVLLAIISALSQDVEATGVFLVMAIIIFYILGARIRKKKPREKVEFLGGKGLFSSWYWFNEKGIWKDNKFFLPWTAISDILVLRTFVRYYRLRTFTVLDAIRPNPESVEFGTIKIVTNDGRQIEINEVVSPHTVVEFIKKTYLK